MGDYVWMLNIVMVNYLKDLLASNGILFCFRKKKRFSSNDAVGSSKRFCTVCFVKVEKFKCNMMPLVQHWCNWH